MRAMAGADQQARGARLIRARNLIGARNEDAQGRGACECRHAAHDKTRDPALQRFGEAQALVEVASLAIADDDKRLPSGIDLLALRC